MAKIYYMVDVNTAFYPVWYIDLAGEVIRHDEKHITAADACQEFEHQHPGAQWLDSKAWDKRLAQLSKEKALLASWTGIEVQG